MYQLSRSWDSKDEEVDTRWQSGCAPIQPQKTSDDLSQDKYTEPYAQRKGKCNSEVEEPNEI